MEEQFIRLQWWNKSVDEYAAKFLRLSRFAQYMIVDEEKSLCPTTENIFPSPHHSSGSGTMTGEEESYLDKEPGHERPFQQMGQGGPVKLQKSRWPNDHFNQLLFRWFNLLKCVTISRGPVTLNKIAVGQMGYAWHVASVATRWKVVHIREREWWLWNHLEGGVNRWCANL